MNKQTKVIIRSRSAQYTVNLLPIFSIYAIQFHSFAKQALEEPDKLQANVMAVVCNLALCVEFLLKCCDSDVKNSPSQPVGPLGNAEIYSNVWGHNLEKIFSTLDPKIAIKLDTLFKEATGIELKPLIEECKNYFIHGTHTN